MSHFFILWKIFSMDLEAIVNRVKELVTPLLNGRGVSLVELICRPQGGGVLLRFLVDTAQGVTLAQLSQLNRAIGAILDEHDLIPERYMLEVSSPGLDRPLKSQADFERVMGRQVKVLLKVPVEDSFEYVGKLVGASEAYISLELDSGKRLKMEIAQIARAVQEINL